MEKILQYSGCCEEDCMDIKTAVAEACLNAIEHGNGMNPDLSVNIHVRVIGNAVTIEVCDHGEGAELKALTGNNGIKAGRSRGWGLHLIDKLVDEWEYFHKPKDKLFCLKMKKNISKGG